MRSPGDDWDRHWDQYAQSAEQNPAQRLRRRVIRSWLALDGGPARLLDIGCGQGDLIAELKPQYPQTELCGIDYSQAGIEVAQRKVPGATFMQRDLLRDAEIPPQLQRWATHAVCSEVLEHVDDPATLLKHATAYLAPGCRFVVTVPGGPMSAFDRHIGHRTHYTADGLRQLLVGAGFEVHQVRGVGFPFFNLYRLAVIQRGERLVAEVAKGDPASSSLLARVATHVFRGLFLLNLPRPSWGWQIVGLATYPKDLRAWA
jgi:trans-aconitate methyltransferase